MHWGSAEFPAVVIPVAMQHYMLLQRNLIYTGFTRAKRLLVVFGEKKAMGTAPQTRQDIPRDDRPHRSRCKTKPIRHHGLTVRNDEARKRYSGLLSSLKKSCK